MKSAARTVELLELLAARRNRPARLRELAEALGAPRSSIYALLRTLVDRGWVRTDPTGMLYSVGIQALLTGTTYLDTDPYLRIVQPLINDLGSQLDETIHYGRLQGTDIVYLGTRESSQQVRPFSRIGRRLPAYSTAMGKALLAEQLQADELSSDTPIAISGTLAAHLPAVLTPSTRHTLIDPDALLHELLETRMRGYGVDREESLLGVSCFAVPLQLSDTSADALSCSVPVERLTAERETLIIEALRRTKHTIERMVPFTPGGSGPAQSRGLRMRLSDQPWRPVEPT